MLVPQGMAYAMIAGLPVVYGLYAALVPQIVYGFFGTSRHLAVGPVAMDSLLVAAGLGGLALAGTERYIELALLLSVMMGLMQWGMGMLRMGFMVHFLSKPVISGFTSAAAILIGLNQLPHLGGVACERSNQVHLLLGHLMDAAPSTHGLTLGVGLGAIGILAGLKAWVPKVARRVDGRVGQRRGVLGRGARSSGRSSGGPHSKRPSFCGPSLLGHERCQNPVARGIDAGLGGLHGGHQRGQGRGRKARLRRGRQPRTQSLGHGQCARGVVPKLPHHGRVFPHRGHRAIRRPNTRHRLDCGGGGGLDLGPVDPPVSPSAQRRTCGRGAGGRGRARGHAVPAQALAPRQMGDRRACHHLPRHPRGELAHGHWRRGDPRLGLVDSADDDPSPRRAGQRPRGAPECGTLQGCGGCARSARWSVTTGR